MIPKPGRFIMAKAVHFRLSERTIFGKTNIDQLGLVFVATTVKKITVIWKKSIRAFIDVLLGNMEVDTGMSYASLHPLGLQVNMKTILSEAMRGKGPRLSYTQPHGRFADNPGPGEFKSPVFGSWLGERAYTLEFGTQTNPVWKFNFKIVVLQHYLQELSLGRYNSSNPMNNSLKNGREAFLETWETSIKAANLPRDIVNFIESGKLPQVGEL
jgi:hypothetical protein